MKQKPGITLGKPLTSGPFMAVLYVCLAPLVASAAPGTVQPTVPLSPGVFHAWIQPHTVSEAVPWDAAPQHHALHLQQGPLMPTHSMTPPAEAPSSFVSLPDPPNMSFCRKLGSFNWFPEEVSDWFPAAVTVLWGTSSCAQNRWCHRVPQCPRGVQRPLEMLSPRAGTSGQSRPQLSGMGSWHHHWLLRATIPVGWPLATLYHPWAPWNHLAHIQLSQATPMGCFWGAAVAGASPPCGAMLGQEAAESPSPVPCLRVPGPRGTGKSGVSFERAPAVTGAGKGEAGWLLLL